MLMDLRSQNRARSSIKPRLTSIKINGELIERLCGVCWLDAGLVNNARSAQAIKQTAFTAEASYAFILRLEDVKHPHTHTPTHTRRLMVTYLIPFHKSTASLQTLRHAHRLELKRMDARLSSSHSSFNIYTQSSAKKARVSLSFFSGKKPKRSALDDSGTVVVNGTALRARMVI